LILDCSNGVGASKFRELVTHLFEKSLHVEFINEKGPLNEKCGADFVKISQTFPRGFEKVNAMERCASFDGDADRLVYFYKNKNAEFRCSMRLHETDLNCFTVYIQFEFFIRIIEFLKPFQQLIGCGLDKELSLVIVQTGYANGNSTKYIREEMGLEVKMVPTGVKHLHHEASKYDIGVYFEANGHGTVTFSDHFHEIISRFKIELKRLRGFSSLINEVVGDAMCDLLVVEILLRHYDWSVDDWAQKLYTDAASCQLKVKVRSIHQLSD
uniref:LD02044p (inferred by orthology to a D. melanogaster protein) n=1 Tax=Anisakis simplex TaxID=6269 RepID=A0A0M3J975_ANISI